MLKRRTIWYQITPSLNQFFQYIPVIRFRSNATLSTRQVVRQTAILFPQALLCRCSSSFSASIPDSVQEFQILRAHFLSLSPPTDSTTEFIFLVTFYHGLSLPPGHFPAPAGSLPTPSFFPCQPHERCSPCRPEGYVSPDVTLFLTGRSRGSACKLIVSQAQQRHPRKSVCFSALLQRTEDGRLRWLRCRIRRTPAFKTRPVQAGTQRAQKRKPFCSQFMLVLESRFQKHQSRTSSKTSVRF
jgi:hypothetical protein